MAHGAPELLRVKTVVLGMGNPILTDDAVGVRLATDFRRRLTDAGTTAEGPLDVVEECSVGGLCLLDLVAGHDRLVVLDAIQTPGGVPGAWYRFTGDALRETLHLRNVHDTNLATALELGRRLGMRLPSESETHLFAVEVKDVATFAESMTPELEEAYPCLSEEIIGQVMALLVPREAAPD